jgi:hypothetical protein
MESKAKQSKRNFFIEKIPTPKLQMIFLASGVY